MLSRLRLVVSLQLAKAYRLGVPVPAGRIVRVFNLNSRLVYRYLGALEGEGLVERAGRGLYRVRASGRADAWAEYVLSQVREGAHAYFQRVVPEVYYYLAEPPSIEWLGFAERRLAVVDEALRGRLSPPRGYRVVYASLRGRRWRYSWDLGAAVASPEQALADLLSHDPGFPAEQYLLLNLGRLDLAEVARRATRRGLARLSTFLAFLRVATGRPLPQPFNYLALCDDRVLEERLGEYVSLVFGNGAAERRNV